MRIQHNIMAMGAYRNYTNNVNAMKKNLEKLSSGYKINRAGDDAAGLAISEKMRAQITGLETAQKNAKDGISLVQTAEGALTEVHDMLNRMVSLATQSANGTYDGTDRTQLQKEVNQLLDEINRIADSSNFNGINLLDGSMSQGGQGSSVAGIDRIIKETLGAGEDPIANAGVKTILDGGNNSSVSTVFDVDFTGLSGAQAVDGVPAGAVAAKITDEKDGHEFTKATAEVYSFKTQAGTTVGATGGGANVQVTLNGTETVTNLLTATDGAGKLLSDTYDIEVKDAAGNVITGNTAIAAGSTITLTAKTPGEIAGNTAGAGTGALIGNADGGVTFTAGKDEQRVATTDTEASYEFKLDLTKLDAGQTITLGAKTVTVKNAAGTAGDNTIGISGVDLTDKTTALANLANGDLKDALTTAFSDYDVEVTYDDTTGKADIKLTAQTGKGLAGNQGNLMVKSNTTTNPLDGGVTYTKFAAAPAGATTADFAEVTYQSDDLKAGTDGIAAGTKISIGTTTIEVLSDADYAAAQTAGTLKDNQIKQTDTKTDATVQTFIEKQTGFQSGLVTYNGTNGTLTFKAATSGPDQLDDLKKATTVSVAAPPDPADAAANNVTFDFKLGGKLLGDDVSVAKDASSEDIAKAVFDKLLNGATGDTANVEVNNAHYDVKLNGSKLTFTLKDAPTANNIKGNFDWDVEAPKDTFKGNHTAGTVVTTPGNVGAAGSLANTVFNMTTADLKDGTKITIDGKTVTLAVGANSQYKDAEGAINLTMLDPDNISTTDLHVALGRISEGFGKDGTTNFIVGVNDKANGDTNIGLTVHKKASSTKEYTTLEELGEVFKIETPGTGRALTLQIGDTADDFNQLKVDISDMHAESLGLKGLDISTQDGASAAVKKIKAAINQVSDVRGTLGATQNRLDHTINNLSVMTENIQDAESTIRDTDVAEEMMAYTKNNILIQSAQAMLAQANQVPQGVLQLLG